MDEGEIQEEPPSSASAGAAARFLKPTRSGGGSRWVDGSEVDSSESTHWSLEDKRSLRGLSTADEYESGGPAMLSRRTSSGGFRRRLGKRPKRVDSLDVEAMSVRGAHGHGNTDISWMSTIAMAFQTLGVVYGDMGTSPLYVFSDVFSKVPIKSEVEILGALALIPFAKYVFIVLKANDNGEGVTFALYSLICRYAKVSLLPNQQRVDGREPYASGTGRRRRRHPLFRSAFLSLSHIFGSLHLSRCDHGWGGPAADEGTRRQGRAMRKEQPHRLGLCIWRRLTPSTTRVPVIGYDPRGRGAWRWRQ